MSSAGFSAGQFKKDDDGDTAELDVRLGRRSR